MPQHVFKDRSVIEISGSESIPFLQSLVTADIQQIQVGQGQHTALLTPQGKYSCDFFVVLNASGSLYLDVHNSFRASLIQRLTLYKLRTPITIRDVSADWQVIAWVQQPPSGFSDPRAIIYKDKRASLLGYRGLVPTSEVIEGEMDESAYNYWRLGFGIPEGHLDLIPEKSIILEYGFDAWGSISWDKGCYIGQELMSRTKFRGVVRKGVFPVQVRPAGEIAGPGTPVTYNHEVVGELRSHEQDIALALLRTEIVEAARQGGDQPFRAGEAALYLIG